MKINLATLILLSVLLSTTLTTAGPTEDKISDQIKKAIENSILKEYPGAKIKEIESEGQDCYEAGFQFEGEELEGLYSPEGKKMALCTKLATDQLPQGIRKAIGEKAKVEEVERFDLASGTAIYEVKIKNKIPIYYTSAGIAVASPCGSN